MAQIHVQNPNDPKDVKVFEKPEDMSQQSFMENVSKFFGGGPEQPVSDSGVPLPPRKPTAVDDALSVLKDDSAFSFVPTNFSLMVKDLVGDKGEITSANFETSEIDAIKSIILDKKAASGTVSYKDYKDGFKNVKWKGDSEADKKSFSDPSYRVKTSLGQFSYHTNDKGETIVTDSYDFNDAKELQDQNPTIIDKISNLVKYASETDVNNYGMVRRFMSLFGSVQGKGADVTINLGKILEAMNPVSSAEAADISSKPSLKMIQKALGVKADGIKGPKTTAAIKAFQEKNGLVADGIVGPNTLRALNSTS